MDQWRSKTSASKENSCRRAAKRKACHRIREKCRELRRKTKSIICAKRNKFFGSLPALLKLSIKKFWAIFKSVSKHSIAPIKMIWSRHDEVATLANHPVDIANLLNRYFYSVFRSCDGEMPTPCANDLNSHTSADTISNITLTPDEVYRVLIAVDEDKATRLDKTPAKRLKNCASNISTSLYDLFNKSLTLSKVPHEWKLSSCYVYNHIISHIST